MTNPPWQPYDILSEACPDEHDWHKTGEWHPTADPIWFYQCAKCGAYAKARDGQPLVELDMNDARSPEQTS